MKFKQLIVLISSFALLLSGCSSSSQDRLEYTDTLFDTVISVTLYDDSEKEVLEGCRDLCRNYDELFAKNNENSDIYKINHAKGEPVTVSDDTIALLEQGIYYSSLSKGAFDITIGSISNIWDFKSEDHNVPKDFEIDEAKSHVDYERLILQDDTVQLTDPESMVDVGAVAKGYIADRLKDYLKDEGVEHAVINLGGNVQTIGSKTDGTDYNIGIQKPFDESGAPITSVKISDQSMVTTGIYQRYFELGDKLYHHILDPNTGYPCENNLYSVTIITDSSLTADALSTTCFLLGYEEGMRLINELDGVEAVFITDDNELHYSDNFQK